MQKNLAKMHSIYSKKYVIYGQITVKEYLYWSCDGIMDSIEVPLFLN